MSEIEKCKRCKGKGKNRDKSTCAVCKGSGLVKVTTDKTGAKTTSPAVK
jgi:DnaJ-class molecular chaperone